METDLESIDMFHLKINPSTDTSQSRICMRQRLDESAAKIETRYAKCDRGGFREHPLATTVTTCDTAMAYI